MVTEQGVVEFTRSGRATVKTKRTEACGDCSAQGACRAMGGGKEMLVEVDNQAGAKKGQLVEIAFDSSAFLAGSFLAYIAPVLALMAGAFLGQASGPFLGLSPDSGAALGALILAVGVGALAWKKARKLNEKAKYRPRIRRILGPAPLDWADQDGSCETPA
jgi:sigma-E factor negative regulatory protein RseC